AAEFDRARLIHLMVGRALRDEPPAAEPAEREAAVVRLLGVSVPGACENVSLDVAPGEIVGLAGLVGSGRTELLEALFGLRRSEGLFELAGERAAFRSPRQAMRAGVALVPADRKSQGLVVEMTVRENLMMAATAHVARIRRPNGAR